jgi:hypothetical protein
MGAEATGDEERAVFDKDGEGYGRTAQIIDDDVDFQCFRHPAKKKQHGIVRSSDRSFSSRASK